MKKEDGYCYRENENLSLGRIKLKEIRYKTNNYIDAFMSFNEPKSENDFSSVDLIVQTSGDRYKDEKLLESELTRLLGPKTNEWMWKIGDIKINWHSLGAFSLYITVAHKTREKMKQELEEKKKQEYINKSIGGTF